jgi:branched-chain amino acid transport system ATP-binding protein
MLRVEQITVAYGAVDVLKGVTLEVQAGEIVALIGANGAGKSTTLRTIMGFQRPRQGQITFQDQRLDGSAVEDVVARGLSLVPEGRRIFAGLTVHENLYVATAARKPGRAGFQEDFERVYSYFPRLEARSKQLGWSLSGGEQQMLAIGRALMNQPKLLLLDEPSLGLAPLLIQDVFRAISAINQAGTGVLLVEQNAYKALEVSRRAYVLENGELVASGPSAELASDDRVKAAYLGA